MGFKLYQPLSRVEAVNEFTDHMKDTLEEAKVALAKAKNEMAKFFFFFFGVKLQSCESEPHNRLYVICTLLLGPDALCQNLPCCPLHPLGRA
jgi:hypothetical protein